MSIQDEIKDRVQRGMLFPVLPKAAGSSARRALFACEGLWNLLDSPEGDEAWEKRIAELRAHLEIFVEGGRMHPKYLFLLYPARQCVWEIRCVAPDPSIRVLGLFAAKDALIATNMALRKELLGWQSREWKDVKRQALAHWRHLFPSYSAQPGTDIHFHVTDAIDGKYFK